MSQTRIPSEWLDRHPELREKLEESTLRLTATEALDAYDSLAREYIAKVERGQLRSTETYRTFTRLLARLPPALLLLAALPAAAAQIPECPEGQVAIVFTHCTVPTEPCRQVGSLPAPAALRAAVLGELAARETPPAARPFLAEVATWSDAALVDGLRTLLVEARCASGGAAGPADLAAVDAGEVKAWAVGLLRGGGAGLRVLAPLVEGLPEEAVKRGYVALVALKRRAEGREP